MKTGIIKFYDTKKGFGFIIPDEGGKDIFFHVSGLGTEMQTDAGVQVIYNEIDGRKGVEAFNIVPA